MWAIYALITSFWTCAYHIGNQVAKIPASMFMVYRGLVPIVLLLPFIYFIPPVAAWEFYAVCALQGVVFTFMGYRNFNAMHKWGAEIVTSIHPFSIGLVFFLWILLHPHAIFDYTQMPIRFAFIVAALMGVICSVSGFKKSRKSSKALSYMAPYIVASAVCDALNKVAMSYVSQQELLGANYYYMLVSAIVVAIINSVIYYRSGERFADLFKTENIKYSIIFIILLLSIVFKNLAMFSADNPSYVSATIYTYIIWIMLFGMIMRYLGKKGDYQSLDKKRTILLLIAVVTLILCGQ